MVSLVIISGKNTSINTIQLNLQLNASNLTELVLAFNVETVSYHNGSWEDLYISSDGPLLSGNLKCVHKWQKKMHLKQYP